MLTQFHKIAVLDVPQSDDEVYCSDGELEVAYFASRYNANSKTPKHLSSEIARMAI
jgi:hypothetical protein